MRYNIDVKYDDNFYKELIDNFLSQYLHNKIINGEMVYCEYNKIINDLEININNEKEYGELSFTCSFIPLYGNFKYVKNFKLSYIINLISYKYAVMEVINE